VVIDRPKNKKIMSGWDLIKLSQEKTKRLQELNDA
jgi:hypothetical protein